MVIKQADIAKVRQSISRQLGNRVMLKMNMGRHKVDFHEGVIKEIYPSIFLVEIEGDHMADGPKMLSFSYKDVLTRDVQMCLCENG